MKNQLHALRIGWENWVLDDRFEKMLDILKVYDTGITQIALFTSPVHTPITLEEVQRRAAILEKRIAVLKEHGYSAGINILATIGHHHEDLDRTLGSKYHNMVGRDGQKSRGTYCMRDDRFLQEYVAPMYRIYAKTGADFIWIDDDIRYGHMPIGYGCYCDDCIAKFNGEYRHSYSREALVAELADGSVDVRRQWLTFCSDSICRLFQTVADASYSAAPGITLGFMTGERFMEGYDFARYADVLSDGGRHEIMWRPGGGAYTDMPFDSIVEKAEQIGRQNAYLPDYVTMNVSEVENFPYNLLKKSPTSTALEAVMMMTVGCTGGAFNIFPSETLEPMETILPHFKAIADLKPFCEKLQAAARGKRPVGIHTGWRFYSQAACHFFREYGDKYAAYAREFFSLGLPECYHKDAARVVTLSGEGASVLNDEEILQILSGGVYMDAGAAGYLTGRGFGKYLGYEIGEEIPVDAKEHYVENDLNRDIVGGIRNCRQAFHPGDSFALRPLSEKCRPLASLVDYHGAELTPCTAGLFENELGGRVCIAGYYPFDWVSDYRKSLQIKRIFRWLSGDTLVSYVDSYIRVRNITLCSDNETCVTLVNTCNEAENDIRLAVCTEKDTALLTTADGETVPLPAVETDGKYKIFILPRLAPFEAAFLQL